jgi:adenylate kinase
LPHISSGDIFRENLKNKTELGIVADGFISKGELVPDDITIAMIRERLSSSDCQDGALMDGFPRTPAQAQAFDRRLTDNGNVTAVPYINVPDDVLVERLSGRWTCRKSGHVFHQNFNPPLKPGVCDIDALIFTRDDDKTETVKRRIRVYLEQTQPLIEYYRQRGVLVEVDGRSSIDQVTADLLTAVQGESKS